MSTKAFTSALGYGITVRGYIDADDKLVLLEPEGSGGGDSKFRTATLKIEGFGSDPVDLFPESVAFFEDFEGEGDVLNKSKELPNGEYRIPLYDLGQLCPINDSIRGYLVTITGSYENYIISGDVTITGVVDPDAPV